MATDLECGNQCFSDAQEEEEEEEEEEEGSCFYSAYGDDPEIGDETKPVILHLVDRDCRICHLSLLGDGDGDGDDFNDAIELGCCCKDDLAAAHKHCAETWFKIRGNKTCEICNSIVSNLVVPNEMPGAMMDVNLEEDTSVTATYRSPTTRGRRCINGHRLLNFILACLVFAFVISWLFHFNIPS